MKIKQIAAYCLGLFLMGSVASHADTMVTPPDGFGKRPLTMIVPFGSAVVRINWPEPWPRPWVK